MSSSSRIALLLFTFLYIVPRPALGQTTAAFSGRVTDATGGALVGATVQIESAAGEGTTIIVRMPVVAGQETANHD